MAGGWNKRGSYRIPMTDRVALGRDRPPPGSPTPAPTGPDCPGRHVWVLDPVDDTEDPRPGLLVEWRRDTAGGWEARVVYEAQAARGWITVEEWLPSSCVEPT